MELAPGPLLLMIMNLHVLRPDMGFSLSYYLAPHIFSLSIQTISKISSFAYYCLLLVHNSLNKQSVTVPRIESSNIILQDIARTKPKVSIQINCVLRQDSDSSLFPFLHEPCKHTTPHGSRIPHKITQYGWFCLHKHHSPNLSISFASLHIISVPDFDIQR